MPKEIKSEDLSLEVQQMIGSYSENIKTELEKAGQESIEYCNEEITKEANSQAGSRSWAKDFSWMKKEAGDWSDYIKHFKTKITEDRNGNKRYIWYVGGKKYRLTHLLEHSHALFIFGRPHGSTKAYPHIAPAAERTKEHYLKAVEEAIEKAGSETKE